MRIAFRGYFWSALSQKQVELPHTNYEYMQGMWNILWKSHLNLVMTRIVDAV